MSQLNLNYLVIAWFPSNNIITKHMLLYH